MTTTYKLACVIDCNAPTTIFEVTQSAEYEDDPLALAIILCDDADDIIKELFDWIRELDHQYGEIGDWSVSLDEIKKRNKHGRLDQLIGYLEANSQ